MILDHLENCSAYFSLNSRFEKAFAFLFRADIKELPPAKYEIEGADIFAIIVKEPGKKKEKGGIETHQRYIDIQYVLSGVDEMGWKPKNLCIAPTGDHDPEKDARFFNDEPDTWMTVQPNAYAIFFPEDAHTAMFSDGNIHKVIIKVAVNQD